MTRVAIVDREKCKSDKCGHACVKICPINRADEDCIVMDGKFPVIDESLCIGCGLCVKKCPFHAIIIVNLVEELDENPIHCYGTNMFRLYRLPVPLNEKVVGLIGPNGVGKSTALKILAGKFVPNLGMLERKAQWSEIIDKFKGSELQTYLEKLAKGGVEVGYKMQEVDRIPDIFDGNVQGFIDRFEITDKYVKELELGEILDRDVTQLSGGELQRMAIAACLSREADIYFIDEPGSFNDIKQRMKIARMIRHFAEETGKPVIVVEHDLSMMDMMADKLHVLYGAAGAYGIVSGIKGVRRGINAYLDGFLSEENVRIRDDSIDFQIVRDDLNEGEVMLEFGEMFKKFDNFKLKIDAGKIHQNEIIGVLGANALGKSTFLKMLAGVLKPDSGELAENIRISYKPQYPKADYDGPVEELLRENTEYYDEEWYKSLRLVMNVDRILDKNVMTLSGGELQKVSILLALGRDAEVIALDEPSAYIDVESRWELARAIRKTIQQRGLSAFVVDHDIQFMDFISDKIFIFEGKSGVKGHGRGPLEKKQGMNEFLKYLDITYRRDPQSKRPRINKEESQKDQEQKKKGKYYYE